MPTPKKKTSRSKRDMRRSHDFLEPASTSNCPNCQALIRPHNVCSSCGYYKGKEIIPLNT